MLANEVKTESCSVRPSEVGARSRSRFVPPPFVPMPECRRSIARASPENRRSVDCSVDEKEGFSRLLVPPTHFSSCVFQPAHVVFTQEGYEKLARAKEGPSNQHLASGEASSTGEGDYDMFADEDDNSKPSTDENNTVSQSSSDAINSGTEGGALQNDYVYDESSGYYYSSSLGYYYDPNTGLYCSAASGQWVISCIINTFG
ncbi:uncharacterized protein LOC128197517 [Vigna angularis]|uniref:uncharacterized protein LOC128197517 n=2 Tax=Phaseolus angularis TaxID=3914 RepID=UPI0022B59EBE|nr:uncharacterized protein LOC128197517 [Vigna angularis]